MCLGTMMAKDPQKGLETVSDAERRKAKYTQLIDSPELNSLTPLQKEFLKGRWLDQMLWFSERASRNQRRFHRIRVVAIVCSILAPFLISLGSHETLKGFKNDVTQAAFEEEIRERASLPQANRNATNMNLIETAESLQKVQAQQDETNFSIWQFMFYLGLALSQFVAILVAVEQFFKYGDRWRHYRRTAESLKSHGWQFLQLSGAYAAYTKDGHKGAFSPFANQVEELIQSDVEGFVSRIAAQKPVDKEKDKPEGA